MNTIKVLDCTLRDGGYCNEWKFGFNNICSIIDGLMEANVDVVECGFLTSKAEYAQDITKFSEVSQISSILPEERCGKDFVVMMNYGEYDAEDLPKYDGTSIGGIRIAFHKKDLHGAMEQARAIKRKGYKVFIQAMVSLCYTDKEFMELIDLINDLEPYAFYIVDSFGMMKGKDLARLFYIVEHNLNEDIWIGFHSHNNMQLAYSNAQYLANVKTKRNLIIDSSVYGMGRGAGNLNTELFVEYLNENCEGRYNLSPLLKIIDNILYEFHEDSHWGYTLPNYISAVYNAHPNYAGYLDDKKTLTVDDMNEIFKSMDPDKKVSFDKDYIESLYIEHMERGEEQRSHEALLLDRMKYGTIMLIGPGMSSKTDKEQIVTYLTENPDIVSVSVNFDYEYYTADYIFISNIRRYNGLSLLDHTRCIVTSNIPADDAFIKVAYKSLLNDEETVRDNAGLMAVKFFMDYGAKKIIMAGFDGYSHIRSENFASKNMDFITNEHVFDRMNAGMSRVLTDYKEKIEIEFLTIPKYLVI